MKKFFFSFFFIASLAQAQVTPTPDVLYGDLFKQVQFTRAMGDNKTFVDMVPQYPPSEILKKYEKLTQRDSASLRAFVLENFYLPATPEVHVTEGLSLQEHLDELWQILTRQADTVQRWSSLLPLPNAYVVPGGRFREVYYWDSYFTMQGLAVSKRADLIENMVKNFAYLIIHYGHIPNGNRNYYLSRSQPPYFALMVELLHSIKGDAVYREFYPAMEKEHRFWMAGKKNMGGASANLRVVRMPDGTYLNRYWDNSNKPRQESYAEDVATSKVYKKNDGLVFRNLRGAAESGWDFCSRWFADTLHINTIETTDIVPVDLNGLLYAYEIILSKAAAVNGQPAKADQYAMMAAQRKLSINKYCWDERLQYFFDYDFKEKRPTGKWSLAGTMPLLTKHADRKQANAIARQLKERFLKEGGLVSTLYHTGEQWDAPNGWPPLQFIAVQGLVNYGFHDIARESAERWMKINEKVFANTGKMMEKYNVENTHLESGGGEYPTQDGFGWTNGVYLKFHQMFRR